MHEFRDDGYFYVVEGSCVVLDEMFIMHNFNSFHKWPLNLIETDGLQCRYQLYREFEKIT